VSPTILKISRPLRRPSGSTLPTVDGSMLMLILPVLFFVVQHEGGGRVCQQDRRQPRAKAADGR
jgi:hypothetical protein